MTKSSKNKLTLIKKIEKKNKEFDVYAISSEYKFLFYRHYSTNLIIISLAVFQLIVILRNLLNKLIN
jgi:hypothetical protein